MKNEMRPLGYILAGNLGIVLGIVSCLTLLLIPFGTCVIAWSAKIMWRGVKVLFSR